IPNRLRSPAPRTRSSTLRLDAEKAPPEAVFTVETPADRPAKEVKTKTNSDVSSGFTVSRSFRLPESLPSALLRASTERRIAKKPPFTQEDIVSEAITQWLKRNGQRFNRSSSCSKGRG